MPPLEPGRHLTDGPWARELSLDIIDQDFGLSVKVRRSDSPLANALVVLYCLRHTRLTFRGILLSASLSGALLRVSFQTDAIHSDGPSWHRVLFNAGRSCGPLAFGRRDHGGAARLLRFVRGNNGAACLCPCLTASASPLWPRKVFVDAI